MPDNTKYLSHSPYLSLFTQFKFKRLLHISWHRKFGTKQTKGRGVGRARGQIGKLVEPRNVMFEVKYTLEYVQHGWKSFLEFWTQRSTEMQKILRDSALMMSSNGHLRLLHGRQGAKSGSTGPRSIPDLEPCLTWGKSRCP